MFRQVEFELEEYKNRFRALLTKGIWIADIISLVFLCGWYFNILSR